MVGVGKVEIQTLASTLWAYEWLMKPLLITKSECWRNELFH